MNTVKSRNIQVPLIMFMLLAFITPIFADQDYTQVLADRVEAELANYYMDEFEIRAEADGHVWIEGEVSTLYDKDRVYEITSKVPGVRSITNNLVVDTPTLPDKIIKDNIRDEMKYVSSIVEPERININVDNGVVILTGKVTYQREKVMARTVASWQKGVKGIINNIEVLPPEKAMSDQNLKQVLKNILENQFPLEKNVTVEVENGIVTLNGTTTNLWAKENIIKEFSTVIGVKKVVNNLEVEKTMN